MKRYIRSEHIPDMTERYPEGMRSYEDDYYDDLPENITLGEALDQYNRMVDDVRQVEVYDQVGNCWCIANSIDRAIQKLADSELLDKFVTDARYNTVGGAGEIELTFKNSNWR